MTGTETNASAVAAARATHPEELRQPWPETTIFDDVGRDDNGIPYSIAHTPGCDESLRDEDAVSPPRRVALPGSVVAYIAALILLFAVVEIARDVCWSMRRRAAPILASTTARAVLAVAAIIVLWIATAVSGAQ